MTAPRADDSMRHVWRTAGVVVFAAIMTTLDTTMINVALDHLHRSFHTPIGSVQWVTTSYLLALGATVPLTGWAARRFGTKRVFITSLALFTLGSVLCSVAWSLPSLVAFRAVQGFGGGMMVPVAQMVLVRAAGPERLGRVLGTVGMVTVIAPLTGPALGGLIVGTLGWRWLFLVNIPIGCVVIAVAYKLLERDLDRVRERIDLRGFLFLGAAFPLLTYALSEIGQGASPTSIRVLPLFVAGVVLFVSFVVHALHIPRPLLEVRLFRRGVFAATALATFTLGLAQMSGILLMPFYWQDIRGETPFVAGLLFMPMPIGGMLATWTAGRLSDRIGGGLVAIFGISLILLSNIPFIFIGAHTSYVLISACLLVRGLGLGSSVMPITTTAYRALRHDEVPDATPQVIVLQRLGQSVGTALLAVLLERSLHGIPQADVAGRAGAYGHVFQWVVAFTAIALFPAIVLARVDHRRRLALGAPAAVAGPSTA